MDSWKPGNNRTHPVLIFNHSLVPDRRSCGRKEMQWGEPCLITLKHTSCAHFIGGEGRSRSDIVVRGSDLPWNKNALSGSQMKLKSHHRHVREAWGTGCEIYFPLGVPGCTPFLVHVQQGMKIQQKCWYTICKKAGVLKGDSRGGL